MTGTRMHRLCVMDVDSTLITAEVIELIAERAGTREEVARVTEAAMRGELDFGQSLAARVATLKGLPVSVCADVLDEVEFTPGAENLVATLQNEGWIVALVSGGFREIVEPLGARIGITLTRANGLEVDSNGLLTGRTEGPVIDSAAKAVALREFAADAGIDLSATVAIGDGANDLGMMKVAGLGIAFNAKPIVQEQADIALNSPRLDAALELMNR